MSDLSKPPGAPLPAPMFRLYLVIGLACCTSLEILTIVILGLYPWFFPVPVSEALVFQASYYLAWILAGLVIARNVYWVVERRKLVIWLGAACLLGAGFIAATGASRSLLLFAAAWLMAGIANSSLKVVYLSYHDLYFDKHTKRIVVGSYVLGAFFVLAEAALISDVQILLALNAMLVVVSALVATTSFWSLSLSQVRRIRESRQFSVFMTSNSMKIAAQGFIKGFAYATLIFFAGELMILVPAAVFLGIALVAVVGSMARSKVYDSAILLGRLLPVLFALLIVSSLVNGVWQVVCCCMILVVTSYIRLDKSVIGIITNNHHNLNPITHFACLPMPDMAGAFVGFMGALLVHCSLGLQGTSLFLAVMLISVTLIGAMVVFSKIEGSRHSSLFKKYRDESADEDDRGPVHDPSMRKARFRDRCDKVAVDGGLTKKETEVFDMLARGRNAEYISNHLYISIATAKTHIYHIYSKLEVNSLQELIDLVENRQD